MFGEKILKSVGFLLALLICCLTFRSGTALGKIITPESALFQILENNRNMTQLYLETKASVFDPKVYGPLDKKIEGGPPPRELVEESFTQRVVWVRDEYYLTETMDSEKKLLNIMALEIGGETRFYNPQNKKLFSLEDISFPYLIFYTKFLSRLKSDLHKWGIAPIKTRMADQGYNAVYRLGAEKENLIIEPDSFKVLEINRRIQFKGKYLPLKITFSEWYGKNRNLPLITKFFINSRLFKEIRVTRIKFNYIYKHKRNFLKKYLRFFSSSPSLKPDVSYSR